MTSQPGASTYRVGIDTADLRVLWNRRLFVMLRHVRSVGENFADARVVKYRLFKYLQDHPGVHHDPYCRRDSRIFCRG
jgi:hypothetical protein